MRLIWFGIMVVCISAFSCVKQQEKVGYDQTISFDDVELKVNHILDWRCPKDLDRSECIDGGNRCEVSVTMTKGIEEEDFTIKLGQRKKILGYSIKLVDVDPYPTVIEAFASPNSSAIFKIKKS